MIKRFFFLSSLVIGVASLGLMSCSSGDDSPSSGDNSNGDSSGNTTHVVPNDPDSGNNNNPNPDNVNPDGTTGDNGSSGDSGGSGNGGNTGGDSGSGDGGNTGGDSGNTGGGSGSGGSGSTDNSGWKLVFSDDFEGDSSTPNTEYWTLTPKGTDTWNRHMSESYDQAFQQNGYLYLYGELKDGEYLTGGIETREKFSFEYGQVKCRARFLRQPQGNHTGIWMMPETQDLGKWPRSGEIDIMEHLDDQDVYYSTVHYFDNTTQKDASSDKEISLADHNDFNIYGVVWSKDAVTFTLNGEPQFSYKNADAGSSDPTYQYPFEAPFYLILSQSLGGKGTWEGVIDNDELPAIFQIDWIQVYQKADSASE